MSWFRVHFKKVATLTLLLLVVVLLVVIKVVNNAQQTQVAPQTTNSAVVQYPLGKALPSFGQFTRVGGISWEVGEITLTYTGISTDNGKLYLLGTYPDKDNKEREIKAFIGNIDNSGSVKLISNFVNKKEEFLSPQLTSVSSITNVLEVGKKVVVQFLISVPDYNIVVSGSTVCKDLPNICALGERTVSSQKAYVDFWDYGTALPEGIALNSVSVSGF